MNFTTAVLLAGGRGTRLGALTDSSPKPLLDVAGRPFILYLLEYLCEAGMARVVLSTGYLADQFEHVIGRQFHGMRVDYVVEQKPLGTGGATARCLQFIDEKAFVFNADTLFLADLSKMEAAHRSTGAIISIALREVEDASRYGAVKLAGDRIVSIGEKEVKGRGLINGGIYILDPDAFTGFPHEEAFSLEREFLPWAIERLRVYGHRDPGYFIDMGVPEDLVRAGLELSRGVVNSTALRPKPE